MRSYVLFNILHKVSTIFHHQWLFENHWNLFHDLSSNMMKGKKEKEKREFWIVCNREIDIIVERNRNAFRFVIRLWSTEIVSRVFLKDGRKGGEQKESESNSSQKTLMGPSNGGSRVLFLVELKSSVIILGSDVLKREASPVSSEIWVKNFEKGWRKIVVVSSRQREESSNGLLSVYPQLAGLGASLDPRTIRFPRSWKKKIFDGGLFFHRAFLSFSSAM